MLRHIIKIHNDKLSAYRRDLYRDLNDAAVRPDVSRKPISQAYFKWCNRIGNLWLLPANW